MRARVRGLQTALRQLYEAPLVKKFLSNLCILGLVPLLFAACAGTSSRLTAVGAVKRGIRATEDAASLAIKPDDHHVFVEKLDSMLYAKDFYRGNDLTLRWRITKCHRGSRALRYLVGFGAGRAKMLVEAVVLDSKGKVIGNGVAEGDQTMGVMGGSFASAVEEAAEETAAIARSAAYGR
jgi:hypothetical protein